MYIYYISESVMRRVLEKSRKSPHKIQILVLFNSYLQIPLIPRNNMFSTDPNWFRTSDFLIFLPSLNKTWASCTIFITISLKNLKMNSTNYNYPIKTNYKFRVIILLDVSILLFYKAAYYNKIVVLLFL